MGSMGTVVSVWAEDLDGTVYASQLVNQQHAAAGLMNLPVALAAHRRAERGELDLDAMVSVHAEFDSRAAGRRYVLDEAADTDPDTWAAVGGEVPLRDLVRRSLTHSGVLAAALVAEQTGAEEVAAVLADAECSAMTEFVGGVGDAPAREAGQVDLITAHDAGRLLAGLGRATLASEAGCAEIESWLRESRHRDALPLGIDDDVPVGNTVAAAPGTFHDIALVRPEGRPPVVVCLLTSGMDEDEAEFRVGELARQVWQNLAE